MTNFSMATILSRHRGLGVFGPAYRFMFENDTHAPDSVDIVLMRRMVLICPETADFLYGSFTPLDVAYARGSRPRLEEAAGEAVRGCESDEDKVAALARFTAGLGANGAQASLDEMRFGGTEEQILQRGSEWCSDVARLACALYQVAGFPARLVYLADLSRAYSGHAIVEVHRRSVWGAVDSATAVVYRDGAMPVSVKTLTENPGLIERHGSAAAAYTTPGQFAAAAVSNYFVRDAGRYSFATSGLNAYYRSILEQAGKGWPGGLEWLHGEDGQRRNQ